MTSVGWIFSLVRSGSSAAAYGAAAPWGLAVADEPFGPWDRTGPPHCMPARQRDLARAFAAVGHSLTAEIVGMANDLFRTLGERDPGGLGRVICKCPHLLFTPESFATWFAAEGAGIVHRPVSLIRNPLRRVNSAYARGWASLLNDPFELEVYREFAARWARAECRLRYDELRREPQVFFAALFRGLGFEASAADAEAASAYVRSTYHSSSGVTGDGEPARPRSESVWAAPGEVLDVYLADEQIRAFMVEQGWPARRSAYEGGPVGRLWRTLSLA
jgi:hypothetical protein